MRLQQLIFAYVQVRAREQGIDLTGFTCTSIQITKNLRTKRHKDKKNSGFLGALAQGFVASLSFRKFARNFRWRCLPELCGLWQNASGHLNSCLSGSA